VAKILSQDEIDALLTTVSHGDSDGSASPISLDDTDDERLRSIVVYDFKHPNRVSKDQIRTIENMHDNFAGHFGSALSGILRSVAEVDLVSVDQITYSEFIMSLVTPSCTYTFAADPLEAVCLVDFNPTLTFSFIDRMFGGHGKILESERELTGIERSVMGRLVARLYKELEKTWEHLVKIKTKQMSFETNPQFIAIVPPGETVVVISFQIKLFQSTGLLTVCYPYVALEPVIDRLSAQNWIDATKKKNLVEDRMTNEANIQAVESTVEANLLKTNLKMRDFLQLKIGDIVPSEAKITNPMSISVNGKNKYFAKPGLSGKKRAFQVLDLYSEKAEEITQ